MASKKVPYLSHVDPGSTMEIHIVTGVVRDGGGNVTNEGNSRRCTVAELLALVPGAAAQYYHLAGNAVANITASEILLDHAVATANTLPANLANAQVSVGTNPAATFALDVQKNGVSIGTISISNAGVVTKTTVGGTSKALAVGDVVTVIAPAGVDASIARLRFTLRGLI